MTSRRRRVRNCVEDDTQRGAPPPRRSKNLANISIRAQLTDEKEEPLGASQSSPSYAETKDFVCKQELIDGTSNKADVESTSADICAICLMPRTNPTLLDSCDHSFCYSCTSQWLKHAGKCPLCMTAVNSFYHNLSSPPSERPMVLVAELRAAAEAARLAERGRSLPPLHEQECVRLHIRRLQRRLRIVQEQMSQSSRVHRSSELASANVRLVNEISRLDMLKRDATTRSELIGNMAFRSLIYKDNLDWSSIDRNANRVRFSPEIFNANADAFTERLRPFVDREMEVVWRKRKPNESQEDYKRRRDVVVSRIISWCSEYQINSPQFSRNLRWAGLFPPYVERFQTELFDFASSMVSLEDFDSMSAYSSKELRQLLRRRNRRAENAHEIVVLSESDSDSAVIPLGGVRRHTRHNRNNDEVIVLSDESRSGEEPTLTRGESNYVRDEAASSNSEASNFGDFYTRPACRLSQPVEPSSIHVVDSFGFSREIFPRSRGLLLQVGPSRIPLSSVHSASNNEQFLPSSPALGNCDTTIVLSSDDECSARRDLAGGSRTDVGPSQLMRSSSSLLSRETCPLYVNWLNPSNAEKDPNVEQYKQYLMSCNNATYRVDVSSPQLSLEGSSLSSQDQVLSVDDCKLTGEVVGETTSLAYEGSLSESSEAFIVQRNALHENNRNPYVARSLEESASRECSASIAYGKNHATSQSSIIVDSSLPQVTPCEATAALKSLFKPAIRSVSCASNQTMGENELLASLWKERQRRLATSQQSDTFNSSISLVVEQKDEQKNKEDLLEKEKTTYDCCGKRALKTSTSNPLLNETTVDSVIDLPSSYQSPSNSSNLVAIPSSSQCLSVNLSADGSQSSYDLKTALETKRVKRNRKKKHYSWKFLFKQFSRKLRHERSRRKRKKLYEFIEKMKESLDKEHSESSSDNNQDDQSKEEVYRGSESSTLDHVVSS